MKSNVLQTRRPVPTAPDQEARSFTKTESIAPPAPAELSGRGLDAANVTSDIDLTGLLGEPPFAIWASEAARRYGTTSLHALELLARALMEDGTGNEDVRAEPRR
jgi:hypothetical protein